MYRSVEVKICGLTREEDVDLALSLGADYIGFIIYPESPRGLRLERAAKLAARVPEGRRVVVDVETAADNLERYRDAGFDCFQIHTRLQGGLEVLQSWMGIVGRERLWLAPRLAPGDEFPGRVLAFTDTVLIDTFSKDQVGGTGRTGDWGRFAEWRQQYGQAQWILAGGLSPANVLDAISQTGASRIDVNSGVESAPGKKDPEKLRELFRVLRK